MKIRRLTLTGADDNVDYESMLDLSHHYPFIEWGILLSKSKAGSPRYPSGSWIAHMPYPWENLSRAHFNPNYFLSYHLCGSLAQDFLLGDYKILDCFCVPQRLQINFNGMEYYNKLSLQGIITEFNTRNYSTGGSVIFQYKPSTVPFLYQLREWKFDILFDCSGGSGLIPQTWPEYKSFGGEVGYAGGLNPYNLRHHLDTISNIVGDKNINIDLESGIRDSHNQFSFDLAEKVCQIVQSYNLN